MDALNISGWNELFWDLVREREQAHNKIYLAFDESMLLEAFNARHLALSTLSVTQELNLVMQRHCRRLYNGDIGLSETPDGACLRDNWSWVFERRDDRPSLCLVFAAHQIIAAEKMQGLSYYAAYWQALGVTPQESRVNPFGDAGKLSFRRLWESLKRELCSELDIPEDRLTFKYGAGPNKYRNLPISQSLLNEKDLTTLASSIPQAQKLSDQRLYGRMTQVKLSASGHRKVISGFLRDELLAQFRDFFLSGKAASVPQKNKKALDPRRLSAIKQLVIQEEHEIFGDVTVHCSSLSSEVDVDAELDAYLKDYRGLVFVRDENFSQACEKPLFPEVGEEAWLVVLTAEVESILRLTSPVGDRAPLGEVFQEVRSSLADRFLVLHCSAMDFRFASIELVGEELVPKDGSASPSRTINLEGGICVYTLSSTYICWFGPHKVHLNGALITADAECALNYEKKSIRSAIFKLKDCRIPRNHELEVDGARKTIRFVDLVERSVVPTAQFNHWNFMPSILVEDLEHDDSIDLGDPLEIFSGGLAERRNSRLRLISVELQKKDFAWRKTTRATAERCLWTLNYLQIPSGLHQLIQNRIEQAQLVPAAMLLYEMK